MINSVCVYCGSSPGTDPTFMAAAQNLGACLAGCGIRLVYGGAGIGLMGAVADAALAGGSDVIGVIPERLADRVGHLNLTEQHIVPTMHERKQAMFDLSDAFVVLPGGLGTLEEMFELLTWAQLRMHTKPVGILNVDGFYDDLLVFLDSVVQKRFLNRAHRDMLIVERTPDALLERFEHYEPVLVDKWMGRDNKETA